MTRCHQQGMTLVETMVVVAMLIPLLYAAVNATSMVQRDVGTNERLATVNESVRRVTERVLDMVRPALASSFEVRNDPGAAWQAPLPANDYRAIRFLTDDPLAPSVQFEFVRDSRELANGRDDDGDGLVDEGSLRLVIGGGPPVTLASHVELATFRVDGALTFTMRCGRRDYGGRVLSAQRRINAFIRNS